MHPRLEVRGCLKANFRHRLPLRWAILISSQRHVHTHMCPLYTYCQNAKPSTAPDLFQSLIRSISYPMFKWMQSIQAIMCSFRMRSRCKESKRICNTSDHSLFLLPVSENVSFTDVTDYARILSRQSPWISRQNTGYTRISDIACDLSEEKWKLVITYICVNSCSFLCHSAVKSMLLLLWIY